MESSGGPLTPAMTHTPIQARPEKLATTLHGPEIKMWVRKNGNYFNNRIPLLKTDIRRSGRGQCVPDYKTGGWFNRCKLVFKGETLSFFRPVMLFVSMEKWWAGFWKGLSKMKTQIESACQWRLCSKLLRLILVKGIMLASAKLYRLKIIWKSWVNFFGNNYSKTHDWYGCCKNRTKITTKVLYTITGVKKKRMLLLFAK